jgi:hypothetical protein
MGEVLGHILFIKLGFQMDRKMRGFSRPQHDGAFAVEAVVAERITVPSPTLQDGSPRQRLERENSKEARPYRQQRSTAIAWVPWTPYGISRVRINENHGLPEPLP